MPRYADETTTWLATILRSHLFSTSSGAVGGATDVLIGRAVHTPRGTFCIIRHTDRVRFKESVVNMAAGGRYTRYIWRRVAPPEYRVCLYQSQRLLTLYATAQRGRAETEMRYYAEGAIPLPAPIAESLV